MILGNFSEFFKRLLTGIILLICLGGGYLHSPVLFSLALGAVLLIVLVYEWPRLCACIPLSLVYPITPFATLIWLTLSYYHTDFYLPLYPFLVAWTADTCGYAVGKLVGYHKMCPSISPGKSWEGFAGSCLGVFIMHLLILPRITLFAQTVIARNSTVTTLFSIAMTTIAFLGGFFLSYLKRKHGLKDAGSVLPGHGGFLDRFDAVLFVAVTTVFFIFFHRLL